jgi:two-component system response regulator FixJ
MSRPVVVIVDDDEPLRDSISLMLQIQGHETKAFPSASAVLEWLRPETQAVVVSDVRMPGMSGLELIQTMRAHHCLQPAIMVTAHADVPLAVQAMKAGASDFFEKPFDAMELARAVTRLIDGLKAAAAVSSERAAIELRLASLSVRETEVLEQLVEGKLNKVIAHNLSISPRTVEVHRSNILAKMGVRNTPELIHLILSIGRT